MIINHNLPAVNANNKLNKNVVGVKKATEKLSSGFRINRAADDAAGLAISEKMRAHIRGLSQAVRNANDGISLIQTAEGALDEVHDMLKRLKELAVQAGNETYSNEERAYMQQEINAIKNEVDRIAESTDFNGIKLLDGSTSGSSGVTDNYGARYGTYQYSAAFRQYVAVSSSIANTVVEFTENASGIGGENAFWDESGKRLTINLVGGIAYTDTQINTLIKNANIEKQNPAAPTDIKWKTDSGVIVAANFITNATVAGVRQEITVDLLPLELPGGTEYYADKIRFTANQYGSHKDTDDLVSGLRIITDVGAGKEKVVVDKAAVKGTAGAEISIHLATGTEYTNRDIENLLLKAGFDYSVEMFCTKNPDGDTTALFNKVGEVRAVGRSTGTGSTGGSGGTGGIGSGADFGTFEPLPPFYESSVEGFGIWSMIDEPLPQLPADQWVDVAYYDFTNASDDYIYTQTDYFSFLVGFQFENGNLPVTLALTAPNGERFTLVPDFTNAGVEIDYDIPNFGGLRVQSSYNPAVPGDEYQLVANFFIGALCDLQVPFTTAEKDRSYDGRWILSLDNRGNAAQELQFVTNVNYLTNEGSLTAGFFDYEHHNFTDNTGGDDGDVGEEIFPDGQGLGREIIKNGKGLILQIGADNAEEQRVTVSINAMDSNAIGISDINVSTVKNAQNAMGRINGAITAVSAQRAYLGAMQNRLEYTVNNLTVTGENLTAAESQIRDTDMATEMVQYIKFTILQQAAGAMLAQANQSPQAVLQLLR